jgi:hypothetical protein
VVRNCGFSETFFFVVYDDIWIAIYPSFVVVARRKKMKKNRWHSLTYTITQEEEAKEPSKLS